MFARGAMALLAVSVIGALANPVVGTNTDASITPAATTVSAESSAGAALFPFEIVQLTDETLKMAAARTDEVDVLRLFGFEGISDDTEAATKRAKRSGACKAFPGDVNYPNDDEWSVFDALLGGAFIKTTPVAAPCYKTSTWNDYDEAKCADVSARFTTAGLQ
jgi:hypothetical protein